MTMKVSAGVLVVCRDVTREHLAKLALQERETELARVQAIGRIGGLEVDLRTGLPQSQVARVSEDPRPSAGSRQRKP